MTPQERLEYNRAYYAANKEYWRKRYLADPETFSYRRRTRRDRLAAEGTLKELDAAANRRQREKMAAEGTLTSFDRARHNSRRVLEILAGPGTIDIAGQLCVYCGDAASCVDHVIPISRGGTNEVSNLAPACTSCNSSKRDRLVSEWPQNPQLR